MTRFLAIIIGLIVALIIWMIVRAVRMTLATANVLRTKIEPALAPLREGRSPSPDRIHELAAHAPTRSTLWRALRELQRHDLFPSQYATSEALAESDMVVWLMHGNELGAAPDESELVETIERAAGAESRRGRYFVFRFRTNLPHWAATSGWMAGVAGPYFAGDDAFDAPAAGVFSKFEAFETRSAEEHLAAIVPVNRTT